MYQMRFTSLSKLFAVLLVLLTAAPVFAADWTIWGGRPLKVPDEAIRVGLGWPSVDVAYHFPFDTNLELAPKVSFKYGLPAALEGEPNCCGFGLVAGSEIRWSFLQRKGFSAAVRGEAGLALDLMSTSDEEEGAGTGIRLGPGIALDYAASPDVNVVGGLDIPIDISLRSPSRAVMPFIFRTGLEFHPTEDILVFTVFGLGPAVVVGAGSAGGFALNGQIGMASKF